MIRPCIDARHSNENRIIIKVKNARFDEIASGSKKATRQPKLAKPKPGLETAQTFLTPGRAASVTSKEDASTLNMKTLGLLHFC